MTEIGNSFNVGCSRTCRMTSKPSIPAISRSSSTALTSLEESTFWSSRPALHALSIVSGRAQGLLQQLQGVGVIVDQQNFRVIVSVRQHMLANGFQKHWFANRLNEIVRSAQSKAHLFLVHDRNFAELQNYAETKHGKETWNQLLNKAGLENNLYLPLKEYPDTEVVALVTAASSMTGLPTAAVLEDFGEFMASALTKMFGHLLRPGAVIKAQVQVVVGTGRTSWAPLYEVSVEYQEAVQAYTLLA
jgi:Haem-NO-binding